MVIDFEKPWIISNMEEILLTIVMIILYIRS